MPDPAMRAIEMLRIEPIELTHSLRQIRVRRLNQDVVVIGHLTPRMTDPAKTLAGLPENLQPGITVIIRQINVARPSPREVTWYTPPAS